MSFFSLDHPLWLPKGSVRAILAIGLTVAFVFSLVPLEVAMLVLGFYFGSRGATQ